MALQVLHCDALSNNDLASKSDTLFLTHFEVCVDIVSDSVGVGADLMSLLDEGMCVG
jgi:hypothetical protein